ncbi:MAG: hypothetical protein WBM32_00255 [Crocosphaera sp.]
MSEFIYPTIDLFIYDIRDALNTTDEEINNNLANFQNKLPPHTQLTDIPIETEYLELLPNQKTRDFKTNYDNKTLQGYYYPVRLNDTYCLQIDCSIDNKIEPQPLQAWQTIKSFIEQQLNNNKATLGKTWLLSACIPNFSQQSHQKIAQDSYNYLFKEQDWQNNLREEKPFLDGKIFELWHHNPSTQETHHVIIIIYNKIEQEPTIANFYTDWLGLFCYQHKIFCSYYQSRLIKQTLLKFYRQIETKKQQIKTRSLDQKLAEIKDILENYTTQLPKLNFQKEIVEINLTNYQRRLKEIKTKLTTSNSLPFFSKFIKLSRQKYLLQISKDHENMEIGLRLLESNINLIRSQIEAEKAKGDRTFQALVTIVGTGTAVNSLIDYDGKKCQAIVKLLSEQNTWCDNNLTQIIVFPMTMILIFGILGLGIKSLFR